MSWQGTIVPNTGTIEKIYINNKLSYEEVVDIVRKANLTPTYGTMYPVAISIPDSSKPNEFLMLCVGFEDSDIAILLIDNAINTPFIYFSTTEEAGFVGWNPNIQNIDPLIAMSNFEANNLVDGITQIGSQNEALSSLISITPFVPKELKFRELKVKGVEKYEGNVVPNTGNIENVYLNTNLSVEEVVNAIESANLNYISHPLGGNDEISVIYSNEDLTNIVYLSKSIGSFISHQIIKANFITQNIEYLFNTHDIKFTDESGNITSTLSRGWHSNDIIEINSNLINLVPNFNIEVGVENYKLTNLFSSKPFTKDVGDVIETSELPSVGYQGTAVPNTGTIEKVYINTNLTQVEVVDILKSVINEELGGYITLISNNNVRISTVVDNQPNIENGNECILINLTFNYQGENVELNAFSELTAKTGPTGIEYIGWNPVLLYIMQEIGYIEVNSEVLSSFNPAEGINIPIGDQNEALSSLFSITPFTTNIDSESIYKITQKPTAVPNTGTIEKVYFNTNLTTTEVDNIITNANLTFTYDNSVIATDSTTTEFCIIINAAYYEETNGYSITAIKNEIPTIIYLSNSALSEKHGVTWFGWNTDFNGVLECGVKLVSTNSIWGDVGTQNDKLSSLFSTTPFGEDKLYKYENEWVEVVDTRDANATSEDILVGKTAYVNGQKVVGTMEEYNGGQSGGTTYPSGNIDITENGVHNVKEYETATVQIPDVVVKTGGGTPVPNTGTIEKVYFNTNLSIEEVKSIIDNANLTFEIESSTPIILNKDIPFNIVVNNAMGFYVIMNTANFEFYWAEQSLPEEGLNFSGWNPNLINPLEVNVENQIESFSYFSNNEALSSLFSITPFGSGDGKVLSGEYDGSELNVTENGIVDINSLLDEQKLPLKINVNVASSGSGEDMLQARVDATNSCANLFYKYSGNNVDYIANLDTSNATNMSYMFQYCSALKEVPQFNTSNATNMSYMFQYCGALETIPQLDTSKVTNMQSMFQTCSALETIDITYFNISSILGISSFVKNCTSLKALIIRSFGANYVLHTNSFDSSSIANGTGYIYVPRAMVDTLKSATDWSTYADQIRALEDYTVDGTTTGALDETKI